MFELLQLDILRVLNYIFTTIMLKFALQSSDYELGVCSPHTKDETSLMISHKSIGHYRPIGDLNKMYHVGKRRT